MNPRGRPLPKLSSGRLLTPEYASSALCTLISFEYTQQTIHSNFIRLFLELRQIAAIEETMLHVPEVFLIELIRNSFKNRSRVNTVSNQNQSSLEIRFCWGPHRTTALHHNAEPALKRQFNPLTNTQFQYLCYNNTSDNLFSHKEPLIQ